MPGIHPLDLPLGSKETNYFRRTGVITRPRILVGRNNRHASFQTSSAPEVPRSMITPPSYYLDAGLLWLCSHVGREKEREREREQQRRHRFPADSYYRRHCVVLGRTTPARRRSQEGRWKEAAGGSSFPGARSCRARTVALSS